MARIVEQVKFPVPKFKKQINTAAYARVSSGKDAMLHSLSAQVSYYSDLIQKNPEWRFCGVQLSVGNGETCDCKNAE